MDITKEYYLKKYDELSILSDTEKCRTSLMRNRDTGEIVVKKIMQKSCFPIYHQLKEIHHKNIVNILECFDYEEQCITIEEYVNGKRIDDYCADKKITMSDCVRLGIEICNGLEVIHQKGIIHRDIQPKNIIISNEGTLKLIDLDISRRIDTNKLKDTELLGTAGYAPPEQYGFSQTSNRSDIYSVGVVLKEILQKKGFLPDERLDKIINKCLEIDPQNRYASVVELRNDLKNVTSSKEKQNEGEEVQSQNIGEEVQPQYTEKDIQSQYIEEELPPITLKYIISTIPGFRSKNFLYSIFAIFWYGIFISACGAAALDYKNVSIYNKIIGVILAELSFIVPYMYLTNIAHIAMRFPKKRFHSKSEQLRYQIGVSIGAFIILVLCLSFVLPI